MDLQESVRFDVDVGEALKRMNEKNKQLFDRKIAEYNNKFNSPEAKEYFRHLVAAMMLEYNEYFGDYSEREHNELFWRTWL